MAQRRFQAPRGFRDILPEDLPLWEHLETTAARLARNSFTQRTRQTLLWNAKKIVKKVGGRYWLAARKRILDR